MRRILYAVRNTGIHAAVPFAVAAVALVGFIAVKRAGNQAAATYYASFMRLIAPLFAAWWPLFVFKERVEGDGRELLYFLHPSGESATAIVLATAYLVLLLPLGMLASFWKAAALTDASSVWGACFSCAALAFWGVFATRSSPLALLFVVAFSLFGSSAFERVLAGLTAAMSAPWLASAARWAAWAALSALLLAHGERLSRRFTG